MAIIDMLEEQVYTRTSASANNPVDFNFAGADAGNPSPHSVATRLTLAPAPVSNFPIRTALRSASFQSLIVACVAVETAELRKELQLQRQQIEQSASDRNNAALEMEVSRLDTPTPATRPLHPVDLAPAAASSAASSDLATQRAELEKQIEERMRAELDEYKRQLENEFQSR
jgi:hypothetical protein